MSATSAPARPPGSPAAPAGTRPGRALLPRRNPWRHPWFLEGFTWLYLIWSLVPIALAVLFSFNNGQVPEPSGRASPGGGTSATRSTRSCTTRSCTPRCMQTVRLSVYTTLIAVPLGVAFALGINRWRGDHRVGFNFVMILSFVIPELIFGVAMFFVFTELFTCVHLGHLGRGPRPGHLERQLAGHHRAGPAGHDRQAVRGGGRRSGRHAVADHAPGHAAAAQPGHLRQRGPGVLRRHRRLRDRRPAVLERRNTPMSVYIYSTQHGGNGGPALNALGTIMLVHVVRHRDHRLHRLPLDDPRRAGQPAWRR